MNHYAPLGRRENSLDRTSFRIHARKRIAAVRLAPEHGIRYRAALPIMVLAFRDNHEAAVTIQAGTIFDVVGVDRDDRFMIVRVGGEEFLVFESDLKDRGRAVSKREESPEGCEEKAHASVA
jgi:hypothetical protein